MFQEVSDNNGAKEVLDIGDSHDYINKYYSTSMLVSYCLVSTTQLCDNDINVETRKTARH